MQHCRLQRSKNELRIYLLTNLMLIIVDLSSMVIYLCLSTVVFLFICRVEEVFLIS